MVRKLFSRYLRWLCVLLAVYFAVTAVLSTVVDPWRINAAPWALASLDGAREISTSVRVGKAALANRGDWEAVIIGSSRVEIGLDPGHPAFAGQRSVNLAMAAALVYETVAAGHYTLDRNPKVRTLLIGIEPGDLNSDFDTRQAVRFYQSPFADNNRSIERTINQLIGGRSLIESIGVIQRHVRGGQPKRSPLGQWLQPSHPPDARAYAETYIGLMTGSIPDQWQIRPQMLRREKAELLLGLLTRARRAGIETHVFLPPQHALKLIHPTENRPDKVGWEADLLALADLCRQANAAEAKGAPVRLWNFLEFNDATTTAMPAPGAIQKQVPGWFDPGHGQKSVGDRVLNTMFSGRPGVPGDRIGTSLLDSDWEAVRAAWIEAHARYCAERADDVAWWRALVAGATGKPAAAHEEAEADS